MAVKSSVFCLTFLFVLSAYSQQNTATVYKNSEFQIRLPVPRGSLLCSNAANEHDHGAFILLGTSDMRKCHFLKGNRAISVFGYFNATDDTKTLSQQLKLECSQPSDCFAPPKNLRIVGRKTVATAKKSFDGGIDILVLTQGGKPDPDFDPAVPTINYAFSLHTNDDSMQQDLEQFRAVLRTTRLAPY